MKNKIVFIFAACMALSFSLVYAHPPSDIAVTYDPASKVIIAIIYHEVSNPENHYIKKVDIGLNGSEIATLDFSKQENNATQPVKYQLENISPEDVISVEAYCSINGKLRKEIKVLGNTGK